jgi:hypothetical protein
MVLRVIWHYIASVLAPPGFGGFAVDSCAKTRAKHGHWHISVTKPDLQPLESKEPISGVCAKSLASPQATASGIPVCQGNERIPIHPHLMIQSPAPFRPRLRRGPPPS